MPSSPGLGHLSDDRLTQQESHTSQVYQASQQAPGQLCMLLQPALTTKGLVCIAYLSSVVYAAHSQAALPPSFPHDLLGTSRPKPFPMWKCALPPFPVTAGPHGQHTSLLDHFLQELSACDRAQAKPEAGMHVLSIPFRRRHRYFKILIVGDSGLGKTTLVRALLSVPGQRLELHDGALCLVLPIARHSVAVSVCVALALLSVSGQRLEPHARALLSLCKLVASQLAMRQASAST